MASFTAADLNPLERQRIREAIRRYGGDMSLLPLADEELDGALGLIATVDGIRRPTLAGLLLMGREEILRQHAPAHEVAFQVLSGTDVQVNEFFVSRFGGTALNIVFTGIVLILTLLFFPKGVVGSLKESSRLPAFLDWE